VFAGISIKVTEKKTWNDLDGTNSESKYCDPTPSEKVTSKETQISLENLSVQQTELASKSIIQHNVAMNTTTDKIKEKKKFQTITGIHIFSLPKIYYCKKEFKMVLPTKVTHVPYNHHNFAFFIYSQYSAFCTSYNISHLIKNTK